MQFTIATTRPSNLATRFVTGEQRVANRRLWTAQAALAAVFLFAGGMKLVAPADTLAEQSDLPVLFLRFIGACEVLGAAGLVLPGLFHTLRGLTPLAASGLVVIMTGAVVVTLATGGGAAAVLPAIVGIIAAYVVKAYWFARTA